MRAAASRGALVLAALALGACTGAEQEAKAPPGVMESFADRQSAERAATRAGQAEAARAKEASAAADARQKTQAAEGIERFERMEARLDAEQAKTAQ